MAQLRTKKGNLLEASEQMIIHGCNARGAMGSGIARAIRKKWPEAYRAYRIRFEANDLNVGDVVFVDVDDGKTVANAITQETHGRSSRKRYVSYDAVSDCMGKIRDAADRRSIPVVAMPRIGAGLAIRKLGDYCAHR